MSSLRYISKVCLFQIRTPNLDWHNRFWGPSSHIPSGYGGLWPGRQANTFFHLVAKLRMTWPLKDHLLVCTKDSHIAAQQIWQRTTVNKLLLHGKGGGGGDNSFRDLEAYKFLMATIRFWGCHHILVNWITSPHLTHVRRKQRMPAGSYEPASFANFWESFHPVSLSTFPGLI
jgi:hypothetical protein